MNRDEARIFWSAMRNGNPSIYVHGLRERLNTLRGKHPKGVSVALIRMSLIRLIRAGLDTHVIELRNHSWVKLSEEQCTNIAAFLDDNFASVVIYGWTAPAH